MQTSERAATPSPIRLCIQDHKIPVLVFPEDNDNFVLTMHEAIRACRQADSLRSWQQTFYEFLGHVNAWSRGHADVVTGAYITPESNGLGVFIVTKGDQYRPEFDDSITDLDIDVSQKFPACPAHVMHMPEDGDALTSFFDPQTTLRVYGE